MYRQKRNPRSFRGRNFKTRQGGGGGYGGGRGRRIKTFDPRTVIGKATNYPDTKPDVYETKHKFSDFELDGRIFQNILNCGYDIPTPIQDQAIPQILADHDVVGIANTGTGKTAAFLIPLINKVVKNRNSKVLIIAPTRELAVQIDGELNKFAKGLNIFSAICIGGVPIKRQIKTLYRNPQFVIGTPGRLLDLENQRKLNFYSFESIVLDEVDRMLDMGFVKDVENIISNLPEKRQSLFFSATLDPKILGVMNRFIKNPVMISVKTTETRANVVQEVMEINGRNKQEMLREYLDRKEVVKSLVFTRTKRGADTLFRSLATSGFQTAVLHGNKSQSQRQKSLDQFGRGNVNVLIATDVASRGIDVADISHVVNYDLPESYDAYIHRIGRTGRMDKKGVALTFVGQ